MALANDLTALKVAATARFLMVLKNTNLMSSLVKTNIELMAGSAKLGESVNFPTSGDGSTYSITPSNIAPNPTDTTVTNLNLLIDQWEGASHGITTKDFTQIVGPEPYVSEGLEKNAEAVRRSINQNIFSNYKYVYNFVGTSGTTPFGTGRELKDATEPVQIMNENRAEVRDRFMILNPKAWEQASRLDNFVDFSKSGTLDPLVENQLTRFSSMNWGWDNDVPRHIAGTIDNGAGDKEALVNGALTAGDQTMNVDNTTLTGTVVEGDVFKFATLDQGFVVTNTTPVTAAGNAMTGITFAPALPENVADGVLVTVEGDHDVNLAFQREAFAFQSVEASITGDSDRQTVRDAAAQIVMSLNKFGGYHQEMWEFSALFGSAPLRVEHAVRVLG
jgi:hypothetical protein